MKELFATNEGNLLQKSREKANVYLRDGNTFALSHAIDLKLGLGQVGFTLAVSYCATQLLHADLLTARKDHAKSPNWRLLAPLRNLTGSNVRVLELTEDFLERERVTFLGEQSDIPHPDPYSLSIRQAVQNLFFIERAKSGLTPQEYQESVAQWGEHWKTRIASTIIT